MHMLVLVFARTIDIQRVQLSSICSVDMSIHIAILELDSTP